MGIRYNSGLFSELQNPSIFTPRDQDGADVLNGVFSLPLPGELPQFDGGNPPAGAHASGLAGISRGKPLGEFIAGPENHVAVAAVLSVLAPASIDSSTNNSATGNSTTAANPPALQPLVFFGPSGTGKSHLAGGLACEFHRRYSQAAIVHVCAVDFARELADAIETQAVGELERRHRHAKLLIIEDLDHLAGKAAAQEYLALTLDVLSRRGALVVATCSLAPQEMPQLTAALRSRLSGGLVIGLALPGQAARSEIIRRLAATRQLAATDEGVQTLAAGMATGVRNLLGALAYLETQACQADADSGQPLLSKETAAAYLAMRMSKRAPSLPVIAARTAKYYSLRLSDVRGPARHRQVALARNVAIYLARQLTGQSLEKIGKYFGGRDHTTVLHACRRIAQLVEIDPAPRRAVEHLRETLAA